MTPYYQRDGVMIVHGECLDLLRSVPSDSFGLVIADPPYNIGVRLKDEDGARHAAEWDKINDYRNFMADRLAEFSRVLSASGVLYLWQNDPRAVSSLIADAEECAPLSFRSFCIWDKGENWRAKSWKNRRPDGATALRSWFNRCEYCLHFFNRKTGMDQTGREHVFSDPSAFGSLKTWYSCKCDEKRITRRGIAKKYTEVTGKRPYMLRHYFNAKSQFEIPKREIWEKVYIPLGFDMPWDELKRQFDQERDEAEPLAEKYELRRNVHHCDALHCNVWRVDPVPTAGRLHMCQKPVEILRRLVRVSSDPGAAVLDPFAGSGSVGVAAIAEGRRYVGIDKSEAECEKAAERLDAYLERGE